MSSAIHTRHLLYHVCPLWGDAYRLRGDVWRWNVRQVLQHAGLFNGRRVVAIATGSRMDTAETVRKAFGSGFEFIEVPNDPRLREGKTLPLLLEAVSGAGAGEAVFVAHAKGVTHGPDHPSRPWTEIMYAANLDYWPLVEELLGQYPVVGCFKKVGRGWYQVGSPFHYSGSFFWMDAKELFSRNWREMDLVDLADYRRGPFPAALETYVSVQFAVEEAGVLFYEGQVPSMNLYDWKYMGETVLPAWEVWKEANVGRKTVELRSP